MYLSSDEVDEYIIEMPISKSDNVANHWHDSSGAGVGLGDTPPLCSTCTWTPQLSAGRTSTFYCFRK